MLEATDRGDAPRWPHGPAGWRACASWAAACGRIVVAPGNDERAIALLDLEPDRFVTLPNGFDPATFSEMTRRRRLAPRARRRARGGGPGEPGSVR